MREIYIFKIRFVDGSLSEILQKIDGGGLMVVPAAPALANIDKDREYHQSLISSHFAIFDSGFLCLLLLLLKGIKVRKISGLTFIREFLKKTNVMEKESIFSIDPTPSESKENRMLFRKYGYILNGSHQYVAPIYSGPRIEDHKLIAILSTLKPKYIIINLGGGVQEKLGAYIQKSLNSYNPGIICTGAAIAFMTGKQTKIPNIMDRFYLGWLARCITNPQRFIPRYIQGFKILPLILREKINL